MININEWEKFSDAVDSNNKKIDQEFKDFTDKTKKVDMPFIKTRVVEKNIENFLEWKIGKIKL